MNRREIILQEIKEDPENPFNYYLLAMEERADGNLENCIHILETILSKHPDYQPTYYTLAEILYSLDQTLDATKIAKLGIQKAKDLQLMKVLHELEQLILLND